MIPCLQGAPTSKASACAHLQTISRGRVDFSDRRRSDPSDTRGAAEGERSGPETRETPGNASARGLMLARGREIHAVRIASGRSVAPFSHSLTGNVRTREVQITPGQNGCQTSNVWSSYVHGITPFFWHCAGACSLHRTRSPGYRTDPGRPKATMGGLRVRLALVPLPSAPARDRRGTRESQL